jgi:hypothetical protein
MHPARMRGEVPDLFPWLPAPVGEGRAPAPEGERRGGAARPTADDPVAQWESLWIDLGGEG